MRAYIRLAGAIAVVTILAGCATTATQPTAKTGVVSPDTCLTSTGSLIPVSPGECMAHGRAYSNEDLRATGQTEVSDALPLLDPSLTVRH
jgi:hypothetical protein